MDAPDRHKIWRIVRNNLSEMRASAPPGHQPAVDVYLVGRAEPVRLDQVHTTESPTFPWELLGAGLSEDDERSPDELRVFTPEQYIQRIELHFVRSERATVGFSHRTLEDPSPTSSDE